MIQQFHFGYLSEENENTNLKRYKYLHAALALFTRAKTRGQPKRPWVNEWIKTVWYTCVMKYYSAIRKSEILSSATAWLKLDGIMPSQSVLLPLLLSRFSRVRLCATPQTAATRLPRPWDSPGKNTGVGCHFLLQRNGLITLEYVLLLLLSRFSRVWLCATP